MFKYFGLNTCFPFKIRNFITVLNYLNALYLCGYLKNAKKKNINNIKQKIFIFLFYLFIFLYFLLLSNNKAAGDKI